LLADRHADGLGGFEAGADLADVPAEEFGVPVLDDAEQPDLAVLYSANAIRLRLAISVPFADAGLSTKRRRRDALSP
jgi:hypothetical protein